MVDDQGGGDVSGWIKLHRRIQDHWLWQSEKPFDKRAAWIDILLMVNHDDQKVAFRNELVGVQRGERITSEPKLAERWGWSRTKVRNFLNLLEKDGMIENKKENRKRTRLKVLNYDVYQGSKDNEKTSKEQAENKPRTSREQAEDINKNDKKEKNDKECKEDIYILTADEQRFLDTLSQVKNYPLDRKKDIEMYKTMGERYPELDLNEAIEQWQAYKLDQPLKPNSNPRSQINTSFRNYVEWGKCLRKGVRKGGSDSGRASPAEKDYTLRLEPEPKRDYTRGLPGF